jgi:hypothetical protein
VAVQDHLGVAAQDELAVDRAGLAACVLHHHPARIARGYLLDLRGLGREVDPELLEDGAPLRRRRGQY